MDWNPTTPALEKVLKQPIIANHRDSPFAYGPRTPRSSLYQKHKPELSLGGSQTLPRNISKETFFSFREQDLDENDMSPLKQEDPMQPGDYEPMAKPRLFIPDEDTGLESLMGSTLKLEDMPDLVRAANALKNTHGPERRRDPVGVVVRFAVLLACFGGFVYLSTLSPLVTLSSPSAIFLERETNTIDNHMDTPSRTPKHIIYAKLLTLLVAGSCITWKLLEKKAAETIASANTPSTEWTIEKLVLAIEAMSGFLLSIYRMSQRNVVLVGRVNMEKLYLGWVLLRAGYDCIVLLQEGQVSKPIRPPVPQLHQRDRPSTASATSASTILPARAQSPAFVSRPISPSPIPMRKSVSDLGSYGSNNSTPIQGRSSGFSRATPTGRGPAAMFNIPNLPLPGGLPPQQGPGRNGLGATGPLITGNRRRTGGAGGQQQGSGGGGGGFSGLRL